MPFTVHTAPAADLRLRTLGVLDLAPPGGDPSVGLLRQPKRVALLAYLGLRPATEFVSRDRLLCVFWPDRSVDQGSTALRQALSFLRSHLGARVLTRGRYGVRVSIPSDALEFEALCARDRLVEALELYHGDLLDGFYFAGETPAFREWLERLRGRYRRLAAEAAWQVATRAERAGRPADAAFWGKRFLDLIEWTEPEVCRVMELLHRAGDRAGALRVYRGLEHWLRAEFGTIPSPTSLDLAQRIRTLPAAGTASGRRCGADRRGGERRRAAVARTHPDRRRGGERRERQRRGGADRRA